MRALRIALLLCLPALATAELVVEGLDEELERNVRAYVTLGQEACDAESWRLQRRYRSVAKQVREALQPFGYYEPSVASELTTDDDCWLAKLTIDPGSPVVLRQVNIEVAGAAKDDPEFRELLETQELIPGARLRHDVYETFKNALQIRAVDRGYVDASFTESRMEVWPDELAADIELRYDSGPRFDFGEVQQNDTPIDPGLVRKYLRFESGTPYDGAQITAAHKDLSASGYFKRVEISPKFAEASDRQIPIEVNLEPADRIEYTVGAGFATDTGPRLRGGYRNRFVNTRGHKFTANLTASQVLSGLTAEYRKPLTDPRSEWMSYTAAIDIEDTDTFDNDAVRVGVRRTKRLNPRWLRTLSADVSYDKFSVGQTSDESVLILPAIAFDHKKADRDVYPNKGRRFSIELRGTSEAIGSTTDFAQVIVRARLIRSIGETGRLLLRGALGATAVDEFVELPPSVRFFAGGDESVRGFDYHTLGPVDEEGDVVGGNHLLLASVEYERRIRGNFYGAVFVDAGNAFDDLDVDLAVGAGVGVKWRSPVGPVRFYLGHPLNKSDRSIRVHVSLGVDL